MIKAIFLDLDSTLLNSNKEITPNTRLTLERCKKSGIKLYTATARPPLLDKMLSWSQNDLSLFDGGVYYNGGCVLTKVQKNYHFISVNTVKEVISLIHEYDKLNISLQLEDEKHAFRLPLDSHAFKSWGIASEEALELSCTDFMKVVKILIFYDNLIDSRSPLNDELIASLNSICNKKAQFYLTDNKKSVQITDYSINKLNGIEEIRHELGYEKDEIAVFGDDINDIEMLSAYKYSFAMGNAEGYIKEAANYITLDNNSDGIYHAICNILRLV